MTDKIVFTDGTVFDSASIISCTYTEQVNSETDICPGAACAAELEFQIRARYGAITQGAQFTYYKVSDTGAETKIGVFTVEKPEKDSPYTYTVFAYDNVSKTYKDASTWLRNHQEQFPLSLFSLVQTACSECGMTLANESLPNGDFQVQAFYADDLQWIQILQWAAQATCRFARMNPDGALEFSWYVDRTTQAGAAPRDSRTVTLLAAQPDGKILQARGGKFLALKDNFGIAYPYAMDGLSFEDYETAPTDKVQIRQSDSDIGVIYPPDASGTNTYVIQGNLLLASASAAALKPVAASLYTLLRGITYTPAKIKLLACDVIHPGDIVRVRDTSGRVFTTAVMTRTSSGGCDTLESTGSPSRDSVSAVNQKSYKNLQGKMLEIAADIDGLNIKASELSGNYSALEQKVDGFTLTVTNGDNTSTLKLKSGSTELSSAEIKFSGMVTFSNLKTAGSSVINGSNITTGTISNSDASAVFDLDGKRFRMGTGSGERVFIDKSGIQWYGGTGTTGATAQGVIKNGLTTTSSGDTTVYGADTRYQKYGWYHGGNFQGITVEQVDNEVMVSGKLSVNQEVSCRTLKAWDAKERVVRTPLGSLQMNAMESPEPLFWDVGSGVCDSTGVCWIALRPEYAETISRRAALRWVVTPTGGPGSLWVEKLDTGAMVHGGAGQRFDWACAGVQRGFEGCYAEGDPGRYPVPENPGDWLLTAAMDEAAVDLPLTI